MALLATLRRLLASIARYDGSIAKTVPGDLCVMCHQFGM